MQASLGNCIKGEGDNEDVHFEDTVRGSDWGCDQVVARMFAHMAPKAMRELAAWGVPWNRVQGRRPRSGLHQRPARHPHREGGGPRPDHGARLRRHQEMAHLLYLGRHRPRHALHVSDRAIAEGIPVHERKEALALIHDGERCHGAVVRDLITGELSAYVAQGHGASPPAASGASTGVTTNALINEGIGAAMALETGVATLGNMEAVQFHPTTIFPAGILVTEGCRGDGGLLRDVDGHRFMPDYEPEKKELASRDVVSRRMEAHPRRAKA
jgi:fumarate reductase flavoprotein subunit